MDPIIEQLQQENEDLQRQLRTALDSNASLLTQRDRAIVEIDAWKNECSRWHALRNAERASAFGCRSH